MNRADSPSPKAAIFDVDGVLLDSYHAHFVAWRTLAEQHGITIDEPKFRACFGNTSAFVVKRFWPETFHDDATAKAMSLQKRQVYLDIADQHIVVIPGGGDLIRRLASHGWTIALASASAPQNVQLAMRLTDVEQHVKLALHEESVTRLKPDPEIYQMASRELNIAPDRCVVIEDSPAGVAAARGAGIACVALTGPIHARDDLNDAQLIVDSHQQLGPDVLDGLLGRT